MKVTEKQLIQVKKTKFVEMAYGVNEKELAVIFNYGDGVKKFAYIPLNKIPQIIRGLFSAYCRFHGKKRNR